MSSMLDRIRVCPDTSRFLYFAVDVFSEFHSARSPAGGTYPTTLAREGDKLGVFAAVAVYPGSSMGEDAAVKVLFEGFSDLIP
jgi:hypothetical protein